MTDARMPSRDRVATAVRHAVIGLLFAVPLILAVHAGVLPSWTLSLGVPWWAWLGGLGVVLAGAFVVGVVAGRRHDA